MLTLGTSNYIKKKFGIGYKLAVYARKNCEETFKQNKENIKDIVIDCVPNSVFNPQSIESNLNFILPFSSQEQLPNLFKNLEDSQESMQFDLNLEMNTLEDAFVNIGLDEERFLKGKKEDKEFESRNEEMIPIPECLFNPPVYNFFEQFKSMFLRKVYIIIRNKLIMITFFLPILYFIIACVVGKVAKINGQAEGSFKLYMVSIFIVQAYCFCSSIFVGFTVYENEKKLKYALNVMGCKSIPYWFGSFLFDILFFWIAFTFFFIIAAISKSNYIFESAGGILLIMAGFSFSLISFAYVWSFIYKNANSAFKTFPIMNIFLFWVFPLLLVMVTQKIKPLTYTFQIISFIFSPFYPLNMAFSTLIINENSAAPLYDFLLINKYYYYSIINFGQFILYSSLVFILENFNFRLKEKKGNRNENINISRDSLLEEDILKEKKEVQSDKNQIKVENLEKFYENGFHALRGVDFGVERKMIFGLLGPNGAGKSTMFNVMTALIAKSSGSVKFKDVEINKSKLEIFKDVAVCPQFDCLWDYLTPVEHLYLFGRMKGLSGKNLKDSVNYFLKTMQLESYVKTIALKLSGGNKRKLCVANALIGGPDLQFFDEPSTGVDAIAKRFLWNTLKQSQERRNSSIVLTTHSMNEADSLCDKIGNII